MAEATAIKERPILMNAEMVRAVLEDRKTNTRRIVKPQPPSYIDELHGYELRKRAPYTLEDFETGCVVGYGFEDDNDVLYKLPYGRVGDRLWVRETFCEMVERHRPPQFVYRADTSADGEECRLDFVRCGYPYQWKPSIHMPREASRVTLEIVKARVERLQDISEEDAIAEGCPGFYSPARVAGGEIVGPDGQDPIEQFRELWERINGAGSWARNDWVWAISFKRLEKHG